MTPERFIERIESYYGKYPGKPRDTRATVISYLRKRYKEDELESLLRAVTMTFSGEYKTVPDIAVFERARVAEIARPSKRGTYLPFNEKITDDERVGVAKKVKGVVDYLAEKKRAWRM